MTLLLVAQAALAAAQAAAPRVEEDVLALRTGQTVIGASTSYVWTLADEQAEIATAKALRMRPLDLLVTMYSESRLQPWANNAGIAVGLIQITPGAAKAMGMTEAERLALVTKSPAEQMPYVAKYFHAVAGDRSYADAGEVYQALAAPGTFSRGSANDVVLYPAGSQAAAANIGLDRDGDGAVTMRDLRTHLAELASQDAFRRAASSLLASDPSGELVLGGGFTPGAIAVGKPKAQASGESGTAVGVAIALATWAVVTVATGR